MKPCPSSHNRDQKTTRGHRPKHRAFVAACSRPRSRPSHFAAPATVHRRLRCAKPPGFPIPSAVLPVFRFAHLPPAPDPDHTPPAAGPSLVFFPRPGTPPELVFRPSLLPPDNFLPL